MTSRALSIIEHTSPDAVRTYFSTFTGRYFERIGGGGDSPENRDVVTTDDLVAVQMLSVTIPARVSVDLLLGELGTQLSELLGEIPTDLDLGDEEAGSLISRESPAWQAWDLLIAHKDMGGTKTSKLLARKRPRLLPVLDGVTRCALGEPSNYWLHLHETMADKDITSALEELRDRSEAPYDVSRLRLLDVALLAMARGRPSKGPLRA